jgi:hypothetical protein
VDTFVINAGDRVTFPWLSSIANNFERYRFIKLSFAFISGQATSMAGKVGLGVDYDPKDTPPANRVEFFTLTAHTEAAPWDNLVLPIECKGGFKFVASDVEANARIVDLGNLLVMSDLTTADTVMGDIIVSYQVELKQPQPKSSQTDTIGAIIADVTRTPNHFVGYTQATSTVQKLYLPMGYFMVAIFISDGTSGSIVATVKAGDCVGVGRSGAAGTATHFIGMVNVTTHNGEIKITHSAVNWSSLNATLITTTYIDKAAYDVGVSTLGTALATY